MKILIYVLVCGALGLVVTSNQLAAQTASGAEARLRERNIQLPPVPSPVANYVDSVRVGKLLFLAGNTAGADWKFKGGSGATRASGMRLASFSLRSTAGLPKGSIRAI